MNTIIRTVIMVSAIVSPAVAAESPTNRSHAAFAVNSAVIAAAIANLDAKEAPVRYRAYEVLMEAGPSIPPGVVVRLVEDCAGKDAVAAKLAHEALAAAGPVAREPFVGQLIRECDSTQRITRVGAYRTLAGIGRADSRILPALLKRIGEAQGKDSPYTGDKAHLVRALGAVGGREVVGPLAAELKQDDSLDTTYALQALAKVGTAAEETVPLVVSLLKATKADYIRRDATLALSSTGTNRVPYFLELLNSEPGIRKDMIAVLGKMGDGAQAAVKPLVAQLSGEHRVDAARALVSIAPADVEVVPALVQALTNEDAAVRGTIARALGRMGSKAEAAVTGLIAAAADPDASVQSAAAWALGRIPTERPEVADALMRTLKAGQPGARAEAVTALAEKKSRDKQVIAALADAMEDRSAEVRRRTCKVLASWGPDARDAIPALEKAAAGGPSAKEAAAALKAIRGEKAPQ